MSSDRGDNLSQTLPYPGQAEGSDLYWGLCEEREESWLGSLDKKKTPKNNPVCPFEGSVLVPMFRSMP